MPTISISFRSNSCSQLDHISGCLSDLNDQLEMCLDASISKVDASMVAELFMKVMQFLEIDCQLPHELIGKVIGDNPSDVIGPHIEAGDKEMPYEYKDLFTHAMKL